MRFTSVNPATDVICGEYTNRFIKVEPLKFQIPRMYMPFGVSGFAPPYGPVKYNIDFSMKGWNEPDNYVKKFYDFLTQIENRVIADVEAMSEKIFGMYTSRDELVNLFNSNIKKSETYDPKFRVKVSDSTLFFDVGDSDITKPLEEGLYKKYSGAALIQFGNIYFFNKRFGITWTIEQIKVYEPQRLHGFNFSEDVEDDEDAGDEECRPPPTKKMTGFMFSSS
jgi:hypothetical protein